MEILTTIAVSLVSVFAGGIITLKVSRKYYEAASKELEEEALNLREETRKVRGRIIDLFAALDEAGLIDVEWDESGGDIKGVRIKRGILFEVHPEPEGKEETPEAN